MVDTTSSGLSPLAKNAKLSVRALVRPNLIPLVGFTGPVLEVSTGEGSTAEWIRENVLVGLDLDETDQGAPHTTIQCPIGILLHVDDRSGSPTARNPHLVSDILIYGTLVPSFDPSSPSSSSSEQTQDSGSMKELFFYGATLCPGLITKARSLPSPPDSPEVNAGTQPEKHGEFAEFLSDLRSPSPKRKRVATLFEAATEYHKKIRKKGPAAMSEYLSREKSATPQFPPPPSMLKIKREVDSQTNLGAVPMEGSQPKPHVMSIRKKNPTGPLSRPSSSRSRSMSMNNGKNIPGIFGTNHDNLSSQGRTGGQEPQHVPADEAIGTNKALLTRTILTCMRLYGFHRTGGRAASQTQTPATPALPSPSILTPTNNEFQIHDAEERRDRDMTPSVPAPCIPIAAGKRNVEDDSESEFKEMYHATYRASSFALRRFLKASPIDTASETSATSLVPILTRDKVMDTVDSVLKLFCEGTDV